MKKFFAIIMIFVAALALVACTEDPVPSDVKEYAVDGEFMAFEVVAYNKGPQVTWVTVTIKDGEIEKFEIDEQQGSVVNTTNSETGVTTITGTQWNEKSKKELGYLYGMHMLEAGMIPVTPANEADYIAWLDANDKLEWFEQAELLEAKWLADGVESITAGEDNKTDDVAGVSVTVDNYIRLAKQAVANAKASKVVTFDLSETSEKAEIIWAEAVIEDNSIKSLVIDTLQSDVDGTEGIIWHEKSKQEKGYLYGMHMLEAGMIPVTPANEAEYIAWLQANDKLEWFEQVQLIVDDVIANGKPSNEVAGTSITTNHYYSVIAKVYAAFE